MKKLIITISIVAIAILGLIWLKYSPAMSTLIWNSSGQGTWLVPLVFFSALLDSIHPCSFSILLITIAFLFAAQMSRKKILLIGGIYIVGIFLAYFLIGLGLLKVLHLFNTPHFMGRLGAAVLIGFGLINIIGEFFPNFPIKLRLPNAVHESMGKLINKATVVAAFGLGVLVGICQFPCMGGPYLMVIGLLRDQATYFTGFGYLLFYNLILIIPLIVVLIIAADKSLLAKVKEWKSRQLRGSRLVIGIAMIVIGLLILII